MDRPDTIARNYLTPPVDSFWAWTDDGSSVIYVDGSPIASRAEIEAVLARLAPRGLPPFGAVVMLLAACQLGWRESSSGKGTLAGYVRSVVERKEKPVGVDHVGAMVSVIGHRIQSTLRALDAVGGLPSDLREKHESKAVLAEILFEQTNLRTSSEAGGVVVGELARGIPGRALVHEQGALAIHDAFMQNIEAMQKGLADLSEERVRLRLLTGLDTLVKNAELDLPPAERARRLINQLVTDRELAGLGRLAQRLVAAVHVPRHLTSPEELPLGGISDLSNRGPLERLLISELAHDDLTLAVRVALNEALYMRREAPPRSPPERRCILIDSGIRTWGMPRLFATAAALALSATADRRAALDVHRARRNAVLPVDLLSREGLVAHLEVLEAAPHPGAALGAWVEMLTQSQGSAETLSDLVIVTHEDVLADPAFLACMPALKETDLYAATVNHAGHFRLQLITRQGRRAICSAKIQVDEVLEPSKAPAQTRLLGTDRDELLPLILGVKPLPLLLPAMVRPEHAAAGPGKSGVAITKDGRLLAWRGEGRGGRELTAQLPHGKIHDVSILSTGQAEVLVRGEQSRLVTLVRADLDTGRVTITQLSGPLSSPQTVLRQADALMLFTRGRVEAYDTGTGDRLASLTVPIGYRWLGLRFFESNAGWSTVAFDGQDIALRPVSGVVEGTIALFDREGLDGPWGITHAGVIYCTASGTKLPIEIPFKSQVGVERISRDGHRMLIVPKDAKGSHLLELDRVQIRPAYNVPGFGLEPALASALRTLSGYNLRRNLKGVALGADGSLLLAAADGRGLALQLSHRGVLEIHATGTVITFARPKPMQLKGIPFSRVSGPRDTRVQLSEAVFADGTRIFLDGRGLLHLKSSDKTLAEVTLVLNDTHVAAWTSSGHACGPAYFLGDAPAVPAATVWDEIQRIVRRLR